ncbi:homer protein homolog 1-like isoform X2 [Entelurus aequoreus]|uniref:homer protein homolog 1-like isoform X2 n=1 Tax=Entelurus aequoreus TaxID=161455 RepID=UPI002B1E7052|nr:homer protein homolog 1-like isoform X2 [Entelurus aequoreus]
MGEQPIFSTRAHIFQIDPATKKNWVATSKHAVTVSYFFDSTRNVYRIISLDGTKAVINSTITPNMTFTKTSQKFGQWADSRANTVYGLGFSSEGHLSKFADKFVEFKEAARLAKEKNQEKMEFTSTPSQESTSGLAPPSPLTSESVNGTEDERAATDTPQPFEARGGEEPSHNALVFSHSSPNVNKHWEAELAALKGNNAKLTAALLESTANVKQWKQQLAAYQEEAERLHRRVTELECVSGQTTATRSDKTALNRTIEELEEALRSKEDELERLKMDVQSANQFHSQRDSLTHKLQTVEQMNQALEAQLGELEQRVEADRRERETFRQSLRSLLQLLDGKILELSQLREALAKLLECS